eukprot:10665798-Lingulodinium_polyedra.AAC.1
MQPPQDDGGSDSDMAAVRVVLDLDFPLLGRGGAEPPAVAREEAAESDEDMAIIRAALDEARQPERFAYRGRRLTAHMRMRKQLKRLQQVVVPDHVASRVEQVNSTHAVCSCDIIDLTRKTPLKTKGAGNYKMWTPNYMCLKTFGKLAQKVPTTSSGRGFARWSGGSRSITASHLQKVRDAIAARYLNLQKAAAQDSLVAQTSSDLPVIEISLDETSM